MEPGKIFGSNEDSRSCESGWTMYLASSPSHDHEDYCYYDHDAEEDSDGGDSMESDASSGPMEATSCLKLPQEVEEQNSLKKKTKEVVLVETTRVHHDINHDNDDNDADDGDDNHDYDYGNGNDNDSAVHSYVGSVRQQGFSLM